MLDCDDDLKMSGKGKSLLLALEHREIKKGNI